MKQIERSHCYLIENVFGPGVIAGFSKPELSGDIRADIPACLDFLKILPGLSYMHQTHSVRVQRVTQAGVYEADGLFTSRENQALVVRTADCLPLIFYSRKLGMTGVVHMGWRSAEGGILENLPGGLSSFRVVAAVGLRKCCYAVGREFLSSRRLGPYVSARGGSFFFDPVIFAREILGGHRLDKKNFFDLGICSFCGSGGFFSYRRNATVNRTLSFVVKLPLRVNRQS